MRLFHGATAAGRWAPGSVIALGNFDGLHRGHQRVINAALARAQALKTKCLAVTFEPHPRVYFSRGPVKLLMPLEKKLEGLSRLGVDAAVLLAFNRRLACSQPATFARQVLADGLRVMDVFVGEDFCFGADRSGTVETLREFGAELGYLVHSVPLLLQGGEKISSSMIRGLIHAGKRAQARALLGWRE